MQRLQVDGEVVNALRIEKLADHIRRLQHANGAHVRLDGVVEVSLCGVALLFGGAGWRC